MQVRIEKDGLEYVFCNHRGLEVEMPEDVYFALDAIESAWAYQQDYLERLYLAKSSNDLAVQSNQRFDKKEKADEKPKKD